MLMMNIIKWIILSVCFILLMQGFIHYIQKKYLGTSKEQEREDFIKNTNETYNKIYNTLNQSLKQDTDIVLDLSLNKEEEDSLKKELIDFMNNESFTDRKEK